MLKNPHSRLWRRRPVQWRIGAVAITLVCAAGSLRAKELPRRQAEEARKVDAACAYLGEGYTRAPGSDTCVKITGSVRADAAVIWGR